MNRTTSALHLRVASLLLVGGLCALIGPPSLFGAQAVAHRGTQAATRKPNKKPKNPLAGRWEGMTGPSGSYPGPPGPMSYRITKAGAVRDLSMTVTPNRARGDVPCPTPVAVVVTLPPFKLDKPTNNFPKGKRFDFEREAASPAGVLLELHGKVVPPFKAANTMNGNALVGYGDGFLPTPGGECKTGGVAFEAHRLGR